MGTRGCGSKVEPMIDLFRQFLRKVGEWDALHARGGEILRGISMRQSSLRRPPLDTTSGIVKTLLRGTLGSSAASARYIDAGFRHPYVDTVQVMELEALQKSFQGNFRAIERAVSSIKNLTARFAQLISMESGESGESGGLDGHAEWEIHDTEALAVGGGGDGRLSGRRHIGFDEDGNERTKAGQAVQVPTGGTCVAGLDGGSKEYDDDDDDDDASLAHADEAQLVSDIDQFTMMLAIEAMIGRDLEMIQRIARAVVAFASSEHMESYCSLWSLRPFVNENVLRKARTLCRSS
ncbi:hypothetical protein CBR_g36746 [Chara braunii]|uniref:DUF7795 domain-containing protein n=1 Tax=Chara braunii TaxID=69332 RepID=A0A388LLC7_CHABU|nr:hypothetical protein CBR_g36746 [Chara braunii]|eukprot:GBG83128.1 hypothetical protein CBR_g36746 [Chara braunii]